ncbi:MAG: DUF4012 domain-containing protein [Candidatus Falkowbacteria bacterium]
MRQNKKIFKIKGISNSSINVLKKEIRSPYVINLKQKSDVLEKKVGVLEKIKNNIVIPAKAGIHSLLFLDSRFRGNDRFKEKPAKIREKTNALKNKTKQHLLKSRRTIKTAYKVSKDHKKVETPASVLLDGLFLSKKLAGIWKYYGADAYQNHKRTINELALFNLFSLIALGGYQALKYFYKFLYYLGWAIYQTIGLIIKMSHLPRLVSAGLNIIILISRSVNRGADSLVEFIKLIANKTTDSARKTSEAGKQKTEQAIDVIKHWQLPKLSLKYLPPHSYKKQLAVFACLVLVLIIPFKAMSSLQIFSSVKGRVLGISEEAVKNIKLASSETSQFNFSQAADQFSAAGENFAEAQAILEDYSEIIALAKLIPNKKAKAANEIKKVLVSGAYATQAGEQLALAFASLYADDELLFTDKLENFSAFNQQALNELQLFFNTINDINPDIIRSLHTADSDRLAENIIALQEQGNMLINGIREAIIIVDYLQIFLGKDMDMRYLIVFQNNAEMRASGGFIGSYALADFSQGSIKKIEAPEGGSYDLQGGLHKRVAAPQPLHLVSSLWEFHDSNWWPDWPKSADKLAWFFENGWGSSVDGVIGLTPTVIEQLLIVLGPIDMTEGYGMIVNADNFYEIIQDRSNLKDETKPKAIIKDLIDVMMAELPTRITADNLFELIAVIEKSLAEKHILFYFYDEQLQAFVSEYGWDGRVNDISGDYLAVINSNMAGGKSDRKIEQDIKHEAVVTPDGSIINTVTITRNHTAKKNEQFAGVRNVNYLRVYVPEGSQLLDAEGFERPNQIYFDDPADGAEVDPDIYLTENIAVVDEQSGVKIYNELNKTVFAHWMQVDPEQTAIVKLKYKLPFKITDKLKSEPSINLYSLLAQKQPGTISSNFSSILTLPTNIKIIKRENDTAPTNTSGWHVTDDLRQDAYFGAIIKIK